MAFTTDIKRATNQVIATLNVKLETLTAERAEMARIERMRRSGYFERPAFPLFAGLADFNSDAIETALLRYSHEIDALMRGGAEPSQFDPTNDFFKSPDAEILYSMVRTFAPRRIVEIGSGHSTRVVRQAIGDGRISVKHIAIDPAPRSDISGLVDEMVLSRFEDVRASSIIAELAADDMLFIDSSHEVRVGNDVAQLFCTTLPSLADGVIVHVHDVFLPFDYPESLTRAYPHWGEQYLLQTYLSVAQHEILWPGYYLQQLRPEIVKKLPILRRGRAQSLWFRTRTC